MDIDEIKALIRALVTSTPSDYTLDDLLRDFEEETGEPLPCQGFGNVDKFLNSLSDVIKVTGNRQRFVKLIESGKSAHVSSLVQRQRSNQRKKRFARPPKRLVSSTTFYRTVKEEEEEEEEGSTSSSSSSHTIDVTDSGDLFTETSDTLLRDSEISSLSDLMVTSSETGTEEASNPPRGRRRTATYTTSGKPSSSVTNCIKAKLEELIRGQNRGIWCSDLPELYLQHFNSPLDFREYGYTSLISLIKDLRGVFRWVRPENGDWLLFDGSQSPSEQELKLESLERIPRNVRSNIRDMVEDPEREASGCGVYLDELLPLYFLKYRQKLSVDKYGFPDVKSFANSLDGHVVLLRKDGSRWILRPLEERRRGTQRVGDREEALPGEDPQPQAFLSEVVHLGESIPELIVDEYFRVGGMYEVVSGDVSSPAGFNIHLKRFKPQLDDLMERLQKFCKDGADRYAIPESMIQPNLICAAASRFDDILEWNRSVIVDVLDERRVAVRFLDFGATYMKVGREQLRLLHRDFTLLPAQSFPAALHNVESPTGDAWPAESLEAFIGYLQVASLEFSVTDIQGRHLRGELFVTSRRKRISINNELVRRGLAAFVGDKDPGSSGGTFSANLESESENRSCLSKSESRLPTLMETNLSEEDGAAASDHPDRAEECVSSGPEPKSESEVNDEKKVLAMPQPKLSLTSAETLTHELCRNKSCRFRAIESAFEEPLLNTEINALAFNILNTCDIVRSVAQNNVDSGLVFAQRLAKNLVLDFMKKYGQGTRG